MDGCRLAALLSCVNTVPLCVSVWIDHGTDVTHVDVLRAETVFVVVVVVGIASLIWLHRSFISNIKLHVHVDKTFFYPYNIHSCEQ